MAGESSEPIPACDEGAAPPRDVPFDAHVELLRLFLARRGEIAGRIENLLNAQRKPLQYRQDVALLSRLFAQCFFTPAALSRDQLALERQLDEAHWASGFKPRQNPGQHNDLVDPAELMARAFMMWDHTRWPGYDARLGYAHTLFGVYLLRRLMLLAMRIWDAGSPRERLGQVQGLLDELGRTTPTGQPVFVRDARWLFALAQSPTTDELHGYFVVAERIAETLAAGDSVEIAKASVQTAGGHLRSQLRHVATQKRVSLEDAALISITRRSNALDVATLMQSLVPLLEAYERAANGGDRDRRIALADAICQGVSPDPELFLNRLDLLGPYGMIEHLFVAIDRDGRVDYTPMGRRHLRLLRDYAALIGHVAKPLHDDCARFRPVGGTYSPYGVLYGFSSRLLEHMALKAAHQSTRKRFTLEDVFVAGDAGKLAWVSGWRNLPHVPREVVKLFEYPQQFAEEVFERVRRALRRRVDGNGTDAAPNGQLVVLSDEGSRAEPPTLPPRYIVSSDSELVAAQRAVTCDERELLHGRVEGEYLVSCETPRGWVAVTKDLLTEVVGAGHDASIAGLPTEAARVLELMCPGFVVAGDGRPASPS